MQNKNFHNNDTLGSDKTDKKIFQILELSRNISPLPFFKMLNFSAAILFVVMFLYSLKTEIAYNNLELSHIVNDVLDHLAEHFSILPTFGSIGAKIGN